MGKGSPPSSGSGKNMGSTGWEEIVLIVAVVIVVVVAAAAVFDPINSFS
jgi:hypothetical protein